MVRSDTRWTNIYGILSFNDAEECLCWIILTEITVPDSLPHSLAWRRLHFGQHSDWQQQCSLPLQTRWLDSWHLPTFKFRVMSLPRVWRALPAEWQFAILAFLQSQIFLSYSQTRSARRELSKWFIAFFGILMKFTVFYDGGFYLFYSQWDN